MGTPITNGDQYVLSLARIIGHYFPDIRGKGRLLKMVGSLISDWPTVIDTTVDGHTFKLDLGNITQRVCFYRGYLEKEVSFLFKALLNPGDTLIDIGANFGYYSILGAKLVGDSGTVYAFEPLPQAFESLVYHSEVNKTQGIIAENLALGREEQTTQIYIFDGLPDTHASLFTQAGNSISDSFTCRVRTLDNYALEKDIDAIHLIKIDVEGSELRVLEGGRSTISTYKPFIIFEINLQTLEAAGATPGQLLSFLHELGYTFWKKQRTGFYQITNFSSFEDRIQKYSCNLCAVPVKRIDNFSKTLQKNGIGVRHT